VRGAESWPGRRRLAESGVLHKFTKLNPALKDKVLLPRLGTSVNPGQLQKTMELMLKYGLMKRPVDLSGRALVSPAPGRSIATAPRFLPADRIDVTAIER
jgi:hypothetical protein